MSIDIRTRMATIIRQHNQGIIDDVTAYHLICNLIAGE